MSIQLHFPGGKRVVATVGAHTVTTDQPVELGGQDTAPAPFDLFLASLATCAGIYVVGFCQARGLSLGGISMVQNHTYDAEHHLTGVHLQLTVPEDFPAKYHASLVRAAEGCKVKKVLASPPTVSVGLAVSSAPEQLAE